MSCSVCSPKKSLKMSLFLLFAMFFTLSNCLNVSSSSIDDLPKCCGFDSNFVEANGSYFCEKTESTRVVIQTDFVFNNTKLQEGECVESADSQLFIFSVENKKPVVTENISRELLPKCCPLDFFYQSSTHSCVENNNKSNQFNATFVRVGLPRCKILIDYELNSTDNLSKALTTVTEEYCVDETTENTVVVRMCKDYWICKRVRCIHKCCPDGQSFVNGSHCKNTYIHGMVLDKLSRFIVNASKKLAIVHGYETGVYIPTNYKFYINENGYFHSFAEKTGDEVYSPREETYCIEHATKHGITYGHTFFRIIPKTTDHDYLEKKFLFNRWAMVISCLFLIVTILHYLISNESAKVFGKALICFCISLLILFMILIYCTFKPKLNVRSTMITCKTIGFLIIYTSFSCFAWLQVMCYDIYWTFGSSKNCITSGEKKRRELKKYFYYCFYGWGLPLIMTLIPLLFHIVDILPTPIKIKIGETKCLIDRGPGNYAEILFFISPLTVMQLINAVFFVKTIRYCLQVKGDIQRMNQSNTQKKKNKFLARKERFGLIIKLSVIMGISYLFEVVSSFYDFKETVVTEYLEIIWDLFNCLQGLFIFIIFICKKKYFKKCRKNIALDRIRKISLTSSSTRTTVVSSVRKSSQDNRRKSSEDRI